MWIWSPAVTRTSTTCRPQASSRARTSSLNRSSDRERKPMRLRQRHASTGCTQDARGRVIDRRIGSRGPVFGYGTRGSHHDRGDSLEARTPGRWRRCRGPGSGECEHPSSRSYACTAHDTLLRNVARLISPTGCPGSCVPCLQEGATGLQQSADGRCDDQREPERAQCGGHPGSDPPDDVGLASQQVDSGGKGRYALELAPRGPRGTPAPRPKRARA
jgi:hypothetical protein